MANFLLTNQPFVFVGLGTLTYTVPATGNYNVICESTEVPPTGLSIVVKNNGSTLYTAPVITPTQSAIQFKFDFQATLNDSVTVVLASSQSLPTDVDNQLNNLKTTVAVVQGF